MAQAEIKAVITAKDEASSVVSGFGKSIGNLALPMAAIGAAIVGFGALAVSSFNDSEKEAAQLNAVLKSTGGVAGVTAAQAQELANSLQKVTRFSDEAVLGAENMLLTFTQIGKDIFPDVTKVTLDFAQALGMDATQAAMQIGKAINDPIEGFTKLQRVGVTFSEDQEKMIKTMTESGNVMGAQKVILQELQKEFGGSAEAAGSTFAGQLDILRNGLDDVMESIGGVIANALRPLVEKIKPVVDSIKGWVEENPKLTTAIIGVVGAIGLLSLAFAGLAVVLGIVDVVGAPIIAIALAVIAIGAAIGLLVEKTIGWQNVWNGLVTVFNTYIKPLLDELWKQIQTQLLPALQEFWDKNQNWIIPALQALGLVLGGIVLGAIMGVIYAIKGIVFVITQVITFLGNLQQWFTTAFQFIADKATWLKDHFWETIGFILGFFATLPIKIPIYVGMAIVWVINYLSKIDWGGLLKRLIDVWINLWTVQMPNAVMGLWNFIRNIDWGGLLESMNKGIVNGISGLIEGVINGALSGLPGAPKVHIPRFAKGIENFSGGMAIVGENGPELVNLPSGSDVIPNNKISGTNTNTTININVGLMTGSAIERREAAAKMFEDLKDIASQRGQTVSQLIGAN